jgi:hypothetical protein
MFAFLNYVKKIKLPEKFVENHNQHVKINPNFVGVLLQPSDAKPETHSAADEGIHD